MKTALTRKTLFAALATIPFWTTLGLSGQVGQKIGQIQPAEGAKGVYSLGYGYEHYLLDVAPDSDSQGVLSRSLIAVDGESIREIINVDRENVPMEALNSFLNSHLREGESWDFSLEDESAAGIYLTDSGRLIAEFVTEQGVLTVTVSNLMQIARWSSLIHPAYEF